MSYGVACNLYRMQYGVGGNLYRSRMACGITPLPTIYTKPPLAPPEPPPRSAPHSVPDRSEERDNDGRTLRKPGSRPAGIPTRHKRAEDAQVKDNGFRFRSPFPSNATALRLFGHIQLRNNAKQS